MESVFSYGTLMDPRVQRRVIGRLVEGRPDVLAGHRREVIVLDGVSYPIAVPDPDQAIAGHVIEVTGPELKRIDRYEGREYVRVRVRLQSGTWAWVYRAPEGAER